jgi:FKBP-type peptidyl-prolyl cis-trans isomerase FklB
MFLRRVFSAAVVACAFPVVGCAVQDDTQEDVTQEDVTQELESKMDKASYAVGVQLGNFVKEGVEFLDMEVFQRGLMDAIGGKDLALDEGSMQQAFIGFQQQVTAKQQDALSEKTKTAKVDGETFLQANGKKDGVVVLPSGLQYKVIKSGSGATPGGQDMVLAHYRGTLIDGEEFDSSYSRGAPSSFPVNRVIGGWTEALQLMQIGDKWELYIPYDLAYGSQGNAGAGIAGYSALVFEIELVGINP